MAAGGVAFIATQWWRPCVGEELGSILNAAPTDLISQLPALTAHMFGTMLPVVVIVLVVQVVRPPLDSSTSVRPSLPRWASSSPVCC